MTTPAMPNIGDNPWGTELNNYLSGNLQAQINTNSSNFASHTAGAPVTATAADPHGDRAYAQQIMAPITSNVNGPGGFVQLNPSGQLPLANWVDLRPVVAANFSTTAAGAMYPPQISVDQTGMVRLAGYFAVTSSTYNGQRVFVNAIPAGMRPLQSVTLAVTLSAGGAACTPTITIGADGSVTLNNCPAGLVANTVVGLFTEFPLDAYYNLIQS